MCHCTVLSHAFGTQLLDARLHVARVGFFVSFLMWVRFNPEHAGMPCCSFSRYKVNACHLPSQYALQPTCCRCRCIIAAWTYSP